MLLYFATAKLSGIWQKMLSGPYKWSATTNLHNKGYHPENTADEGGSAEKSHECRRFTPVLL